MENSRLLVADDDPDVLLAAEMVLKKHFPSAAFISHPERLKEKIASCDFDVALLDMNFQRGDTTGKEGFYWLNFFKEHSPDTQVILMTAYAGVNLAIEVMKRGAVDFVVKPWDNARLLATLTATCRYSQANRTVNRLKATNAYLDFKAHEHFKEFVGQSSTINQVLKTVEKVAATDATVLVLGENGTGKELIARAIHQHSPRCKQPFISVDLGAIPDSLFESEMFGHKKGAFTDAKADKPGRCELANGGTLFLDEIGNLSVASQAKLLRVLETRQVMPLGGDKSIPLNIRVICATNQSLIDRVASGEFREDLLYRINTVEILSPPLRERGRDILLLADFYLAQFCQKYKKPGIKLAAATADKLSLYHWPGNIRELKHTIERAVILADGDEIKADDFALSKTHSQQSEELNLEALEKDAIERALKKFDGNISSAADALGLSRATLYRKMAKYAL